MLAVTEELRRAELCLEYAAAYQALAVAYLDRAKVETEIHQERVYVDLLIARQHVRIERMTIERLWSERLDSDEPAW